MSAIKYDAKMSDWILQESNTSGNGNLTLGAAQPGYITFADSYPADAEVWYSILGENGDRECGIGQFFKSTNTFHRKTIHSTLVAGALKHDGVPLNLNGVSIIGCTLNAEAWADLVQSLIGFHNSQLQVFGPQTQDPHLDAGVHVNKGDIWLQP